MDLEKETGQTEESQEWTKCDGDLDLLVKDYSVDIAVYGEHKLIIKELKVSFSQEWIK